jgi:hypothetical protein
MFGPLVTVTYLAGIASRPRRSGQLSLGGTSSGKRRVISARAYATPGSGRIQVEVIMESAERELFSDLIARNEMPSVGCAQR